MLAVHMPSMAKTLGCGRKAETLGCCYRTTTLGHANNNKRRREDVAEESKRQKVMPKSPVKTPSSPSKTLRAQPLLLKKKREADREAARASLLAMEKEVDVEDNMETFKQLRMLCGGREVVMGSFNLERFGVELVLKKEEEEEHDCSGLYDHLSAIKTLSNPSKPSLREAITRAQQVLMKKKREAARVSLLALEKDVDIEDNLETFKQLRMLCGGREVVMGSFKLHRFGVELFLKKEEEEDDYEDC